MIALGCGCAAPEPPCSPWVDSRVTAEPPRSNVDLLVVLDDTSSMAARKDRLVANLQTMVRRLVTGDVDEDGDPDAPPVALHLGFVSSSLGAGPIPCRDEDGV